MYATVRGRRVLSSEGRQYKSEVALCALSLGLDVVSDPVRVEVDIYRPRRAGDLDNTLKALLDSLTGIVWVDDSQVCEIHARRFEDKSNPRAEVRVMLCPVMEAA